LRNRGHCNATSARTERSESDRLHSVKTIATVVMVTQRTSRTPPAGTTAIQFSSKVAHLGAKYHGLIPLISSLIHPSYHLHRKPISPRLHLFAKPVHAFTHFNCLMRFTLILIRQGSGLTIFQNFHLTVIYRYLIRSH
jgi:hypothetical protein